MNVRELFKQSAPGNQKIEHNHTHCKPLHLPATEARSLRSTKTPGATHAGVVDGTPEKRCGAFREAPIVVSHRAVDVSAESVRELVDEVFCTTETGSFPDFVIVMCEGGVAKCNVLANLRVR